MHLNSGLLRITINCSIKCNDYFIVTFSQHCQKIISQNYTDAELKRYKNKSRRYPVSVRSIFLNVSKALFSAIILSTGPSKSLGNSVSLKLLKTHGWLEVKQNIPNSNMCINCN